MILRTIDTDTSIVPQLVLSPFLKIFIIFAFQARIYFEVPWSCSASMIYFLSRSSLILDLCIIFVKPVLMLILGKSNEFLLGSTSGFSL